METERPRPAQAQPWKQTRPAPVLCGLGRGACRLWAFWQHWAHIRPREGKGGGSAQHAPTQGATQDSPRRGEGADCRLPRLHAADSPVPMATGAALSSRRPWLQADLRGGGAEPCGPVWGQSSPSSWRPPSILCRPSEGGPGLGSHRQEGVALELVPGSPACGAGRLPPPQPLGFNKGWEGRRQRCSPPTP